MIRDDGKGSALDHGLNALAALFGLDSSEKQPEVRSGAPKPPARRPCNCTGRRNPLPPMPGLRKDR